MKIQNFKTNAKTAVLTFTTNDKQELNNLKAFAILHGYCNPLRKEIRNLDIVIEIIDSYRLSGSPFLDEAITIIAKEIL